MVSGTGEDADVGGTGQLAGERVSVVSSWRGVVIEG